MKHVQSLEKQLASILPRALHATSHFEDSSQHNYVCIHGLPEATALANLKDTILEIFQWLLSKG